MRRFISAAFVTVLVSCPGMPVRAAGDKDAQAVIDKAIKALGGEEKLSAAKTATWKTKGTITIGGADNTFTGQTTAQGLDHYRAEFEGEFGGNKIKGVTVIAGDKGWGKFGDMGGALDKDRLANEKRNAYLQLVAARVVPLKEKGFKVAAAPDDKVGGKPAAVIKVTGPDGKDFTLYFDKGSGLPVKQVARVMGFTGEELTQETTMSGYKEFNGIKKATKLVSKRDGEKFLEAEIVDFKVLDKVDPKTFAEPE